MSETLWECQGKNTFYLKKETMDNMKTIYKHMWDKTKEAIEKGHMRQPYWTVSRLAKELRICRSSVANACAMLCFAVDQRTRTTSHARSQDGHGFTYVKIQVIRSPEGEEVGILHKRAKKSGKIALPKQPQKGTDMGAQYVQSAMRTLPNTNNDSGEHPPPEEDFDTQNI